MAPTCLVGDAGRGAQPQAVAHTDRIGQRHFRLTSKSGTNQRRRTRSDNCPARIRKPEQDHRDLASSNPTPPSPAHRGVLPSHGDSGLGWLGRWGWCAFVDRHGGRVFVVIEACSDGGGAHAGPRDRPVINTVDTIKRQADQCGDVLG